MNKDILKSWLFKLLPIVLAFIVGKGWLSASDADAVSPLIERAWSAVDEILLIVTSAATLFRSIKTHNQKPA